jgi:hypothetical protein
MATASGILRNLWTSYMDDVEIPRIKALLLIKKKWADYKMTVFVFPVNLHAFYCEVEGYAGGPNAAAYSVFKRFIVNHFSEGSSNHEFVERYLNRKFKDHLVKVEPTIMKISDEDKVEVANVGFIVNFRRIESIDLDELIVEPSDD